MEIISEKFLGQKLHQEHDIDEMIRKKQAQLQGNQKSGNLQSEQEIKSMYQEVANAPQSSSEQKEDAKIILSIINDTQWGESQEITKWAATLSNKTGVDFKSSLVFQEVQQILQGKYHSESKPLSVKELKTTLQYSLYLREIQKEGSPFTKMLALKAQASEQMIKLSTYLLIKEKSEKKDLSTILRENGQVLSGHFKSLPDIDTLIFRLVYVKSLTPDLLTREIISFTKQLKPMAKITTVHKLDLTEALKIFNYSSLPSSKKQLDIKHKELKKIYHPDKMAKYKLPTKIEKIATENYQMIQKAYEIIMKKID